MEEEQDRQRNPPGLLDGSQGNLLGFLTSRIADYVGEEEDISAEIHECSRQPAKLVLCTTEGI